jgi:hypothetical protein
LLHLSVVYDEMPIHWFSRKNQSLINHFFKQNFLYFMKNNSYLHTAVQNGSTAQRLNGSTAQRLNGSTAQRLNGSTAQRP